MKPLHYLREGTVYIFDAEDGPVAVGGTEGHRLEHYWLCGDCAVANVLERTAEREVRLIEKRSLRFVRGRVAIADRAMAS